MITQISLSQLESHLWKSANIFRGPVDATDFKPYFFFHFFNKRISEVFYKVIQSELEGSGVDSDHVRFPGWQQTHAGEREVKKDLRSTLLEYQFHKDQELFYKAYEYVKEYY